MFCVQIKETFTPEIGYAARQGLFENEIIKDYFFY